MSNIHTRTHTYVHTHVHTYAQVMRRFDSTGKGYLDPAEMKELKEVIQARRREMGDKIDQL
jgi:hypothetical protein